MIAESTDETGVPPPPKLFLDGWHTAKMDRENADAQLDAQLQPLLQRLIAGDEQALGVFYDKTIGHVYGLALRITGRADDAEEIVGDVYLQAWRQADRYEPQRSRVLGWLMMICRSRALDHLRQAR